MYDEKQQDAEEGDKTQPGRDQAEQSDKPAEDGGEGIGAAE